MNHDDSRACHRCFKDKVLIDFIRKKGQRGWCDWCGARNVYVLPLYELGDVFRDAVSIYEPADWTYDSISFLLQGDWEVFSDRIEQAPDDLMQRMAVAILKAGLDPKEYFSGDYPDYEGGFRGQEASLVDHWHEMAEAYFTVGNSHNNQTPHSNNAERETYRDLPDQLEVAFEDLLVAYVPGKILYRARIHKNRFRKERFDLAEVRAPPRDKAPAGRANRKNEPVLYLASDEETALAEVRAWKGMAVAVTKFEVKNRLLLVSLLHYKLPKSPFFEELLQWKVQLAELFGRLADELSRPVIVHEDEQVYFSTQYLADWVRKARYHGIEYPSAMGPGSNLVIFNPEDVRSLNIKYARITGIQHSSIELKDNDPVYEEGPFDYLFSG
jgi:RES domain-containing protein